MKRLKISCLIVISLTYPNVSFSVDMPNKVSDEVVTNLIENHNELINSNILSEICGSFAYLELDYQSDKTSQLINNEIQKVAKQRGLENFDEAEFKDHTVLEFQSFLDGSRYGALIARNYQKLSDNIDCSVDTLVTIKESQTRLIKQGGFVLKKRLVR